ncbi:hypothetical protein MBLNU230_g0328t1 [Neophaeotheca triangularis]
MSKQDQEEATPPQSIQERIAALKLQKAAPGPIHATGPPSAYNRQQPVLSGAKTNDTNGAPKARPPPPPVPGRPTVPPRPKVNANGRAQSSNIPPTHDHGITNGDTGTQPEESPPKVVVNGTVRPGLPPRTSTSSSKGPSLPPRRPSEQQSPALPPRRPSEAPSNGVLSRKASNDSVSSMATARSGSSVSGMSTGTSMTSDSRESRFTIRAPAYDPNSLPPLPPKRTQEEKEAAERKYHAPARRPLKSSNSSPMGRLWGRKDSSDSVATAQNAVTAPNSAPRVTAKPPPPLPGRAAPAPTQEPTQEPQQQQQQLPRPPPSAPPRPKKSALSMGFGNKPTETPPPPDHQPEPQPYDRGVIPPPSSTPDPPADHAPPPVPTSSRPDLSAILASKPKPDMPTAPSAPAVQQDVCLKCRDFSAPDNHAAQFPRQQLPTNDLHWLANQLTQPFPSLTDKARAIFTWLHHNIEYDVVNFFNNNVQPSTPAGTFATGKAVCQGYGDLFATLAIKAGMQAIVVSGHGKGFSHAPLSSNQALPRFNSNHAWNAVLIDNNEWKLIDSCWGAGNVQGAGKPFNKHFAPQHFTKSNNDFGLSHFPSSNAHQYRSDSRLMTWEEYIRGSKTATAARVFSGYMSEEGVDETSLQPRESPIPISDYQSTAPTIRFSFQKLCRHWDPLRNGRGPWYLYTLALSDLQASPRNHIPFREHGGVWWCDVPVGDLGAPGATVSVNAVTKFDGREARGLTADEYLAKKGRVGMAWGGVARWEVGA